MLERTEKVKAKAQATARALPWWLSIVLLWLFVKGCFASGCTAQGGMTEVMRTTRQAWQDSAPQAERSK